MNTRILKLIISNNRFNLKQISRFSTSISNTIVSKNKKALFTLVPLFSIFLFIHLYKKFKKEVIYDIINRTGLTIKTIIYRKMKFQVLYHLKTQ